MHTRETRKPRFWRRSTRRLGTGLLLVARLSAAQALIVSTAIAAEPSPGTGCEDRAMRERIIVLERSATLRGWRFRQALSRSERLLADLCSHDRFNLVLYDNRVDVLYALPQPAEPANIAEALAWLAMQAAGHGRAGLDDALTYALRVPGADRAVREVVLYNADDQVRFTDGALLAEASMDAVRER